MFSLTDARACAEASQAAYVCPPTIKSETAHVLVRDTPTARYIAFRGTASVKDAFTDCEVEFDLPPGNCPGKVHAGFMRSVDDVFCYGVLEAAETEKPLFLCGHSLGGAQAVLAATILRLDGFKLAGIYTFGQPRVGNSRYCRFLPKLIPNHFRIVLAEDIVPRSASVLLGYRHSGQLIFLPSAGGIMKDPPLPWLLFSDIWGALRGLNRFSLTALADHHMEKYIERLASLG